MVLIGTGAERKRSQTQHSPEVDQSKVKELAAAKKKLLSK
jgi:hypothetical protein